jgi:phosphatidylglycerol:prolipoprotein diacylglycerol transferase
LGPRWAHALEGIDPGVTRRALIAVSVAVFAGGRLHVVLNYLSYYAARPAAALRFWAGLHAGGAIVGLVLAAPFVVRRLGVPLGKLADAIVPVSGIGIAIARLGCFLHGCCFGTTCTLPWCVSFPRGSEAWQLHADAGLLPAGAERAAPVHPLELYFAAAGVLITLVALWLHPRKRYDGQVALVALALFSAAAAWLEPFRAEVPQRVHWGPLPELEWIALAMTVTAVVALGVAEVWHRRRVAALA